MPDPAAPSRHRRPRRLRGLGDIIALAAHPIALALDRLTGTHLQHCQACAARRHRLNQRFPL